MHRTLALLAPMALAACAPRQEEPESPATAAATGEPVRCIALDQVISRRPAGAQTLVFELAGGRRYRNELPDHCPGLAHAGDAEIVHVEATGSQLCSGDRVRIYDPIEAKTVGAQAFPHCRLGEFTPIAGR